MIGRGRRIDWRSSKRLGLLAAVCGLACLRVASAAEVAPGAECPHVDTQGDSRPSERRTLEGRLLYRNGIRQWFELRPVTPQCGEDAIQLIEIHQDSHALEELRGCLVRSTGTIDYSPTGYYTRTLFQAVERVEAAGTCKKQPPLPKVSAGLPDKTIEAYRVDMTVPYGFEDRPIRWRISAAGHQLQPWQAYASYWLTGGDVLYGRCGEGFVVDTVFGNRKANPSHFADRRTSDDMAQFDPESAAQDGPHVLRLGYTCVRAR